MANTPKFKERAGAISATVWENTQKDKDGKEYTNISVDLSRSYKDKDNTWKNTSSMRERDLPKAILVLQKAFERLSLSNEDKGDISPSSSKPSIELTPKQKEVYEAYLAIGLPHDRAIESVLKNVV